MNIVYAIVAAAIAYPIYRAVDFTFVETINQILGAL